MGEFIKNIIYKWLLLLEAIGLFIFSFLCVFGLPMVLMCCLSNIVVVCVLSAILIPLGFAVFTEVMDRLDDKYK